MRRAPAWEPSLNREPLGYPHTWVRTGLGRRAGVGTRLNATMRIWPRPGEESMNATPVAAGGSHPCLGWTKPASHGFAVAPAAPDERPALKITPEITNKAETRAETG